MTTREDGKPKLTNWQDVLDYALVVKTLREAMVEANERSTRVLARDLLLTLGEDA
jgi:hypothetical protein